MLFLEFNCQSTADTSFCFSREIGFYSDMILEWKYQRVDIFVQFSF